MRRSLDEKAGNLQALLSSNARIRNEDVGHGRSTESSSGEDLVHESDSQVIYLMIWFGGISLSLVSLAVADQVLFPFLHIRSSTRVTHRYDSGRLVRRAYSVVPPTKHAPTAFDLESYSVRIQLFGEMPPGT